MLLEKLIIKRHAAQQQQSRSLFKLNNTFDSNSRIPLHSRSNWYNFQKNTHSITGAGSDEGNRWNGSDTGTRVEFSEFSSNKTDKQAGRRVNGEWNDLKLS